MFKKEIIQVKKILSEKQIVALCEKYELDKTDVFAGVERDDSQIMLLGISQVYVLSEVNDKIEKWGIHKPNFNQQTGEIDIFYYNNQRSDGIEQCIIQCQKEELAVLEKKYQNQIDAEKKSLDAANELKKQEQKQFNKINVLFLFVTLFAGAFVYVTKTSLKLSTVFLLMECLPIYALIFWTVCTRNVIKYKQYTNEFAIFTILMSISLITVLTVNKQQFDFWYCLFAFLFAMPAGYYLYQHRTDKIKVNKSAILPAVLSMSAVTVLGALHLINKASNFPEVFTLFHFDIALFILIIVISMCGIFFCLTKYRLRTVILSLFIALSLSFSNSLNFTHQYNVKNGDKREAWSVQLINDIPVYMKKDKTIDTKNKMWIDIRQEANHIVDDFLFLLNPSDVIKNIQKI